MDLASTPRANRLHIGIFGRRNYGKSSLINAITGQPVALASPIAGTTTDPVYKAMEIHGIGPCMLIDTAGFDDEGDLGKLRMEKTQEAMEKTDIAILLFCSLDFSLESKWVEAFQKRKCPIIPVVSRADTLEDADKIAKAIQDTFGLTPITVSAKENTGIRQLIDALIRNIPEGYEQESIVGGLVRPGDLVLLVMPQDIQAPKGRLILPQVQTIRDLLDQQCLVMSVTTEQLPAALAALSAPPPLIITDSQVFGQVYAQKPLQSRLTSFSVLMAGYKGDLKAFIEGASAVDRLTTNSRVLIAEACTHAPLQEDIGRVKIPRLLRQKVGSALQIDMVSGTAFPEDLSPYDLIIHCGACMFNRKYVLSRIEKARQAGVPITNYGVVLAKLAGILDKISY